MTTLIDLLKDSGMFGFIDKLEINDDWSFSLTDDFLKEGIKTWDNFGLLEGLDEPDRRIVAYNLTMMSVYLCLNEKFLRRTYGGIIAANIIFPLIRRSSYSEKMTNPKLYWDFVTNWLKEHVDLFETIEKRGLNIDPEAESVYLLSLIIENSLK